MRGYLDIQRVAARGSTGLCVRRGSVGFPCAASSVQETGCGTGVPFDRIPPGVWHASAKAIGRPGLLFHDLRRSAARNLRQLGVDESTIMAIGGWKTPSMFRRYAIVDDTDVNAAFAKLSTALKTPGPKTVVSIRRGR